MWVEYNLGQYFWYAHILTVTYQMRSREEFSTYTIM